MPTTTPEFITPDWDAPPTVHGACSTRRGGVSEAGFASLNLASHVADDLERVEQNRRILAQALNLPAQPEWLTQTHSIDVIDVAHTRNRNGDAALTRRPGQVLAVLTADCLPVLFCNRQGSEIAAAHAGWRGLLGGILEQTVAAMQSDNEQIMAWLGPAIGPAHFEVGAEVREAFIRHDAQAASAFVQNRPVHYLADLYQLARQRLKRQGVGAISGGEHCSFSDSARFYSYRREAKTGRMASLIWMDSV